MFLLVVPKQIFVVAWLQDTNPSLLGTSPDNNPFNLETVVSSDVLYDRLSDRKVYGNSVRKPLIFLSAAVEGYVIYKLDALMGFLCLQCWLLLFETQNW